MLKLKYFIRDTAGFVFAGAALCCLVAFVIGIVIVGIILIWLFAFGGLQSIGNMCILFTVPIFLIVITAILAKRYLFNKGGK